MPPFTIRLGLFGQRLEEMQASKPVGKLLGRRDRDILVPVAVWIDCPSQDEMLNSMGTPYCAVYSPRPFQLD